ncbi:hypothetical protein EG240_13895 [Paenimyroides tangerinum]|uniref:YokE-like PH domain-containing protein n=1 Tax=Paenimyroides tangerinum TaxID=2488728 RepID=A0A3P3VZD8_9FLAO|nr:PH domain-containing protein [Paenimyroides tangerinum]RRJ88155.1 hypothetical protein EG240_13895 [Paenimyroides tangerinum]
MLDNLKKLLNEDQDPKAIEKITEKLTDLLMKGEEIGYIGVQKKPALTVFPDSIVMTNKRIIICKPKNLGLSMSFTDYDWQEIVAPMVKENLLGSEFSFVTKTDLTETIDYIPKNQARKLYTFAKEQLEISKRSSVFSKLESNIEEAEIVLDNKVVETVDFEEVTDFSTFLDQPKQLVETTDFKEEVAEVISQNEEITKENKSLNQLTKEELFEKLQNYKKLLDNGLILQGEYDALKNEVIKFL